MVTARHCALIIHQINELGRVAMVMGCTMMLSGAWQKMQLVVGNAFVIVERFTPQGRYLIEEYTW
jgi:hypothetical protein